MKLPFSKDQQSRIGPKIWLISYALILAFLLYNFSSVWGFVRTLTSLASPFLVGFAIAFLLGPVQRAAERVMQPLFLTLGSPADMTRAAFSLPINFSDISMISKKLSKKKVLKKAEVKILLSPGRWHLKIQRIRIPNFFTPLQNVS